MFVKQIYLNTLISGNSRYTNHLYSADIIKVASNSIYCGPQLSTSLQTIYTSRCQTCEL